MLPPGLETPRQVTLYYDSVYESLIKSGQAVPFLYPWAGLGAFVVIVYLLIDHRNSPTLKWLRYAIFGFLASFQAWCIATNRARHPAAAFGVGLLSAWGVLWVSTIMVVNHCQSDFKRTDRDTEANFGRHGPKMNSSTSNGSISHADKERPRETNDRASPAAVPKGYRWQRCPSSFIQRLDWIADVFCNFRGVGWNWQTSTVPNLPDTAHSALLLQDDPTGVNHTIKSKVGIRRFTDKSALIKNSLESLIIGYIVLDIIKTLQGHDAYFWGYIDAPPPSWLPLFISTSPVLVRSYRLLVSLGGMYFALYEIFKLGPLFFAGILGPKWISTRGEAWMNPPDMFGSFWCIFENGLSGWWGGWWHQTFRVAFNTHSKALMEVLGIDIRSDKGKVVGTFTAFFLSGCLHACASITQLGETRPLIGPMRFFLLQPCGILFQTFLVRQLDRFGVRQRTPRVLRLLTNFAYAHVWLYYTAPILVDDFAKGGVWLFEPIPISPLRALGLGAKDDRWFCWDDELLFWRSGKSWWDTGIGV